eukprot:m.85792 g.85792  ORF g.85792 m.85792 type:complete len:226 (-) comp13024_c0_seq3:73-750(-)
MNSATSLKLFDMYQLLAFIIGSVSTQCSLPAPKGYIKLDGKCANQSGEVTTYPQSYQCSTFNSNSGLTSCHDLCEDTTDCTGFEYPSIGGSSCNIIDDVQPKASACGVEWEVQHESHPIRFTTADNDINTCCFKRSAGPVPKKPTSHHVAAGTAIVLIFFGVLILYSTFGFVYNWTVVGKEGLNAYPNVTFWAAVFVNAKDGVRYLGSCIRRQQFTPSEGYAALS